MEPQPGMSPPANNYDFILSPAKPPKRSLFGGTKDPFITKILLLVGGAVAVMIVLAVIINLFFGSKTNIGTFVALTQTEQEIIRLSDESKNATAQDIKNAAITTRLSTKSHQKQWLSFLAAHNTKVGVEELNLKKDAGADSKLKLAVQTSTFDKTYTAVMRSQLQAYASSLQNAYKGETGQQQRKLLSQQYDDVQLLLKQWPQ